ncbi:MAG: glycosyltransferase family 2 protein [Moorea sp. SIO2I5]|nr:glycosyltransferase family 2 protein [Moorena sp. SIO2I5]
MTAKISVIICTYKPRLDYLEATLEALKLQTLPASCWELIIIENGSDIPLQNYESLLSWKENSRYIFQSEPGLTKARLLGIKETQTPLLCFVDDDNVLAPDYLSEGMQIADEWLMLGVWGGQLIPEFEDPEISPRVRKFWDGSLEKDVWGNIPEFRLAPVGAGVFIRRIVAEKYNDLCISSPIRLLLDRNGEDLSSAGDTDMALSACDVGLGMGRFTKLKLKHLIPAQRTTPQYIAKLREGFGYSSVLLNYVRSGQTLQLSKLEQILNLYKTLRLKGEQREIFKLRLHGEKRALKKINTLEKRI